MNFDFEDHDNAVFHFYTFFKIKSKFILFLYSAKMKNLQMGKKKFNMDPKKGIEYLIQVRRFEQLAKLAVFW
jgi:hypothetical protein